MRLLGCLNRVKDLGLLCGTEEEGLSYPVDKLFSVKGGGYPQFGFNCSYHWNMFLEACYLTCDASSVFFLIQATMEHSSPFISILKDSKTNRFQHLPVHLIHRMNVKTQLATEFYTAVYHIYDNNQCILKQKQKRNRDQRCAVPIKFRDLLQ